MIVDVPDAPDAPIISDIMATSCTVSWTAPANDGGSPITGYFVERQSNVSPRWVRITRTPVQETTLNVTDLSEDVQYEFRVIAVNKKGESKPSLPSQPFIAKNPYGMTPSLLSNSIFQLYF